MKIRDRIRELRRVPASELRPNPKNWRTHPEAQANALKGLLAEVGIADAVLVRELEDGSLMLLDGHLRAETLGDELVPCLVLDVDEAEGDKVLATLDPLAAMAEADKVKLDAILREIDTGSAEVQEMLATLADDAGLYQDEAKEIVEDEIPDPPADPITKPGDLWTLGNHRLLCGDSTKAEDVERLMAGAKADCIVTDPPYGIGIASNPVRQAHAKSDWDAKPVDPTQMIQGRPSIVWGGNYFALPPSKGFLVWDKKQPEDFTLAMCEMAWTNVDTPAKMFRKSVVSYAKEHPTQKPIELLAWCMGFVEGSVYDPFCGSGTTLIAAEQLGRKCYGMEISPTYCDVIVKRWETLAGKKAVLEKQPGKKKAK